MCRFKPLGPDMSVELAPPNIVGRIEGALVCRYTKSRVLLSRQLGDTRLFFTWVPYKKNRVKKCLKKRP